MAPAGGQGGRGTQTASLNQQHFLNIFNVKTNTQRKIRARKSRTGAEPHRSKRPGIAVTVSARGTVEGFFLVIMCVLKR